MKKLIISLASSLMLVSISNLSNAASAPWILEKVVTENNVQTCSWIRYVPSTWGITVERKTTVGHNAPCPSP